MKDFQCTLAHDNRTIFLHPDLYKNSMPTSMINAFSTSVLYSNRTPATQATVFRILSKNVADLLSEMDLASVQLTRLEQLGRVQALVLYQTMRVFDGDIRQRANAEKAMPVLEAWTLSLQELRDKSEDIVERKGRDLALGKPQSWQVGRRRNQSS